MLNPLYTLNIYLILVYITLSMTLIKPQYTPRDIFLIHPNIPLGAKPTP